METFNSLLSCTSCFHLDRNKLLFIFQKPLEDAKQNDIPSLTALIILYSVQDIITYNEIHKNSQRYCNLLLANHLSAFILSPETTVKADPPFPVAIIFRQNREARWNRSNQNVPLSAADQSARAQRQQGSRLNPSATSMVKGVSCPDTDKNFSQRGRRYTLGWR